MNTVTSLNDIHRIFELQQKHQYAVANSSVTDRKKKLSRLLDAINKYRNEVKEALHKDFHKPGEEVDMTELYPLISEIKYVRKRLSKWLRKKVSTPLALIGASSHIRYEPKGVVLIIAPWNFPVNLTLSPLISAIAAGNCAMLKPSEHTPNVLQVIKKIVAEVFEEKEVAVIEGAVAESTALLDLPFNHIFFTGAPSIGKIVMKAASKHLTSVTLELGGKSPTIIDPSANIKQAARRIAQGKFANAGQICIAPDYVLIHESKKEEFVQEMSACLKDYYGDDAQQSKDLTRVVNARHFDRLQTYMSDAQNKDAKVDIGGQMDAKENFIAPTIMSNLPDNALLLQEEIFGPILPIVTYGNNEEVIQYVNSKEKPLALYIYSKDKRNIDYFIHNTRAGATVVNSNANHFFNHHLPFGGVNNSGIGKTHGRFGFEEFSNARAIMKQHVPGALDLLPPPFNDFKRRLIEWTLRWF